MTYRKYDTCFFERYAAIELQNLLGHKFDGLVNHDRPDLQSEDGKRLGIEVTRAMEGGKEAAQLILKEMAGVHPVGASERSEFERIVSSGYAYGLQKGAYVGVTEKSYWALAKPLKEIIRNKVKKVISGFYGDFDEFGLFVFCQDVLSEDEVLKALSYTMDLQKDAEKGYARLFLSDNASLYACNLEDGLSMEYRLFSCPVSPEQRKQFYLEALQLDRM